MEMKMMFYIVFAILIGFGVTMSLIQSGRMVGGIIFLIGGILTFVFFGIRWFEGADQSGTGGKWPPLINSCPDFLVETTRTIGSGSAAKKVRTCIDTIGISRGGLMTKWTSGITSETAYFDLDVAAANDTERMNTLCANAIAKGLSWEGVTDGQVCFATGVAGGVAGGSARQCSGA